MEISENSKILPNISLGFHIYDSHFDAKVTYQNTLNLLFNHDKTILNYNCHVQKKPVAVIGSLDSEISINMATILGTYKIPQVGWYTVQIFTQIFTNCSYYCMKLFIYCMKSLPLYISILEHLWVSLGILLCKLLSF